MSKNKFVGSRQNVTNKFARMHYLLSCKTIGTKSGPRQPYLIPTHLDYHLSAVSEVH